MHFAADGQRKEGTPGWGDAIRAEVSGSFRKEGGAWTLEEFEVISAELHTDKLCEDEEGEFELSSRELG